MLVSKPDLAAGRREDIKRHFPKSLDVFPLSRLHISSSNKLEDFLWAGKSSEHVWKSSEHWASVEQVVEVIEEKFAAENHFNIAMHGFDLI